MIPFSYDTTTKKVTNFLDNVKYICPTWKPINDTNIDKAVIKAVNGKMFIAIPIEVMTDVTVYKFTVTNKGYIFVALAAKIKGVTGHIENFDNCQLVDDVLFLSGPRF